MTKADREATVFGYNFPREPDVAITTWDQTRTRNEVAERLLAEIEGFQGKYGWIATSSGFSAVDAPAMLDAALAAERRATVEQVRALLHDRYRIDAEAGATIEEWDSILDELVAAR